MDEELNSEEVKAWLKAESFNRAWLARQCGVSKGTVNNWLSAGRPITGSAAKIIADLMGEKLDLRPCLDLETFKRLQALAEREGKSIDQVIADIVREALKLLVAASTLAIFHP